MAPYCACVWRTVTRAALTACHYVRANRVLLSERRITPGSRETIGEALCDWETANDFLEVLQRSTDYCSQGESLINQAATCAAQNLALVRSLTGPRDKTIRLTFI